jgi:hypothetical protein
MSALSPKADSCGAATDVGYGPKADIEKQKRPPRGGLSHLKQRANSGGFSLPVRFG